MSESICTVIYYLNYACRCNIGGKITTSFSVNLMFMLCVIKECRVIFFLSSIIKMFCSIRPSKLLCEWFEVPFWVVLQVGIVVIKNGEHNTTILVLEFWFLHYFMK